MPKSIGLIMACEELGYQKMLHKAQTLLDIDTVYKINNDSSKSQTN